MKKRTLSLICLALLIGALALAGRAALQARELRWQQEHVLELDLREHKHLALHIHPRLEIEVSGQPVPIPADIGVSPSGMRVIHTHETDGILHVEAPFPHEFVLGDFFTIWGVPFSDSCILDACGTPEQLKIYLNNQETPLRRELPLRDGDRIRIVWS